MRDNISNAILNQQFTFKVFDNQSDLFQLVVTILFAIIVSEALALFLYRLISTYTRNNFYSIFPSYTTFMYDLIDPNEHPYIPYLGMSTSSSYLSLDERKLLIDKILTTRRFDTKRELTFSHRDWKGCIKKDCLHLKQLLDNNDVDDELQCAICLVEFGEITFLNIIIGNSSINQCLFLT